MTDCGLGSSSGRCPSLARLCRGDRGQGPGDRRRTALMWTSLEQVLFPEVRILDKTKR